MAGNSPEADPLVPMLWAGHLRSGTNYPETAGATGAVQAPADGSAAPTVLAHGTPFGARAVNGRGNSK